MSAKLEKNDFYFIACCILVCVICGSVGIKYFWRAFPEANIDFQVDRNQSREIAETFLAQQGISIDGYIHASIFDYDNETKVFLERTLSPDKTARLLSLDVKLWKWSHRWFKPLQKEEYNVSVTPHGEVFEFNHQVEEASGGGDPGLTKSMKIAEKYLINFHQLDPGKLEPLNSQTEKKPNRTDHVFTWKKPGIQVGDADYRIEITVCGDKVCGYREFLKIPDKWSREYRELRSRNHVTAQVAQFFHVLTVVIMIFFFGWKLWNRDINWKLSMAFSLIAFFLMFGSTLNSFNTTLYGYDTTDSFNSFVTWEVLSALLVSMGISAMIFLFTASAESIYRELYKNKISLSKTFLWQGIRTKSFFRSCILGLTLTFFFIAYQIVFYLVAEHFGAWSPTEVPYSDMVNTVIPWIYVLFFGFFPAVSEEFVSRMFSIPFIQKYFKSTWLAVIIPAFIWGFAHSNYPNQPFYIRGIEVGLVGILIGIVMLKTNILTTLIWHYTVDALYTSFFLLRSGDLYLVVSGAIATGIIFAPLLVSIICYVVKGGFQEEETLLNKQEKIHVREKTGKPFKVSELAYQPLSKKRIHSCMVLVIMFAMFLLWNVPKLDDPVNAVGDPNAAKEISDKFLEKMGVDAKQFKSVMYIESLLVKNVVKYILDHEGVEGIKKVYEKYVASKVWTIRYFKPMEKEEYRISVNTVSGTIESFERTLPETSPGADLSKDEAKLIAVSFLKSMGESLENFLIKDISTKKEKNRTDHAFTWEAKDNNSRNVLEAKYRVKIKIQGESPGYYQKIMKLPENYVRKRNETILVNTVAKIIFIVVVLLLMIAVVFEVVNKIRDGDIQWKIIFKISVVLTIFSFLSKLNNLKTVLSAYRTEIPIDMFLISTVVGILFNLVLFFLFYVFLVTLSTCHEPRLLSGFHRLNKHKFFRDAVLTTCIVMISFFAYNHFIDVMTYYFPSGQTSISSNIPLGINTYLPFFQVVNNALFMTVLLTTLVVVVKVMSRKYLNIYVVPVIVLLMSLLLSTWSSKTFNEYVFAGFTSFLCLLIVVFIVKKYIRDNPLSLSLSIFSIIIVKEIITLCFQSYWYYRVNGIMLLAILVIVMAFLARNPKQVGVHPSIQPPSIE